MSAFEKFFVNRAAERNAVETVELIERSGVGMPKGSNILELGAGRGAVSYLLYRRFAPKRLVVTDYDPSQVALAATYFRMKMTNLPDGVEIRTADAMNLPFNDGEFAMVFASHVLHHVEKHEWNFENVPRALDEIRRVLTTDGVFIYEEIFSKSRIQASLAAMGFDRIFEKGNWPGNRFCVYKKREGRQQPRS